MSTTSGTRLQRKALIAIGLNALFGMAEALCSVFVSVYLWINSHDFNVVFKYYLTIFALTPVLFILAGWYSQARDRLHVYRLGLILHAVFYATLLHLRERSPDHVVALGALLGVTWGIFWAGANVFNFDVTPYGRRDYYFGLLSAVGGIVRLIAPAISGFLIHFAPTAREGYHILFAVVVLLYMACFALSFFLPRDNERRPFHIMRALLPGKDQRDWQWIMWASMSLAGSFMIFPFILSLLMYVRTGSELSVGGFASFQALATVVVSYWVGRTVTARTRRAYMRWGVITLMMAGAMMFFPIGFETLFLFGLFRSISGPMFGIPYSSLRMDVIHDCAEDPSQRIEYITAWEVPLAIGRMISMTLLMAMMAWMPHSEIPLRIILFLLCAIRLVTYQCVIRIGHLQRYS